ncbi:hypothetical protein CBR_g12451 [Chara braunii]|uniref:Reverse transcriptase domain-containing protein n=1 Tax=Chara braunii TaxID=69332 RepID=A0A388JSH0_CHABU|nr:hypothetical protein CBR_g12451 [Chara braunii]|eukprot:GBG60713.1 hypothetical protein CBR_g12451 [Chara braunii]
MNIIREADAIRFGLNIDRSDCGILHGASCKATFCRITSNVLVEVGKVKARACFVIMPDVDHEILLGRSFLSRTETVMFHKHDGMLILLLCYPACGNYEIITCRNTGPRSIRNRFNPGSFTIEESEGERRRLWAEPEAGERVEAFSLSLSDVGKAMDLVATHEMADPDAIHALREQVLECLEAGRLELVYRLPGSRGNPASAQTQSDLQRLNAVTVRDARGLPDADALSKSCAGRPIILLIDLYLGYDQFPVYPPDRPVTAMHTLRGLVHMNVTPQGWTNVVAMVQRAIIRDMQSVSPPITQPYIDDLAVKGPAMKESDEVSPGVRRFVWKHIQDLEKVLSVLEEHNLMASGVKSRHCMREATILGIVCNEKGRRPDVKKTDKITESDFTKIAMARGGRGTRPPRRPLGASGGYERHGPRHRESTPIYDDGDIELFLDSFWDHARRMGWTVAQAIEGLRGVGRFEEPVARIRREATTRSEVEWRMQELRPSPVGPDGRPIRLEIENVAGFIPAFEWFMQGQGKEVIEVGEDTPPQAPAMGLRLGDAPGSAREAEESLQREEAPLPSSDRAPSPEGRAGRRRERAAVRREALTLIDRHLAAYALEHPDLEEPAPAELRREPCQPEKEMEAEIPKRVDLRTRERTPTGETAEEKRARRTRQIDEIWQERQRLEAAGELPEQQQERQRSKAAEALPGHPPSAPARAPEIPKMWRDFWEQRGEEFPSPVRVGFGVARKAEERLDRKIKFLTKTTFDRHLLLEGHLTGKKMKEASHGVRLEAMEMEIQELRALVASQAAIIESLRQQTQGRVDRPESSRQGEQRQPGQGLPGQPSAVEPRQEPPMGRVILEPEEARARRQAEREAFEFRAPTKLATLPVAAADPIVPLAVEEGLPPSSSEPAQGLAEGSMGVLLEAVHTMQEEVSLFSPEQRIEEPLEREIGIEAESAIESRLQRMGTPEYGPEEIEEQPMAVPGETLERRPQRLDTPEYVPTTGDLRSRLGSWATGSGSGGPVSWDRAAGGR